MKGVIIYKSAYGATQQYANWLHDKSQMPVFNVKENPGSLEEYDLVVVGSSVRAGRLQMGGWIRKNWAQLQNKIVILMLVNITADPDLRAKIVPQSLPAEIAEHMKVFPVGGRYILEQMSGFEKTVVKMVASLTKDPKAKEELLTNKDLVTEDQLEPLMNYINSL